MHARHKCEWGRPEREENPLEVKKKTKRISWEEIMICRFECEILSLDHSLSSQSEFESSSDTPFLFHIFISVFSSTLLINRQWFERYCWIERPNKKIRNKSATMAIIYNKFQDINFYFLVFKKKKSSLLENNHENNSKQKVFQFCLLFWPLLLSAFWRMLLHFDACGL